MKKLKKYDYLIITFVCALIIVIGGFWLKHISPFGKLCMLEIDFYHQYGPMLCELYDRIVNGGNLIYSFRMGIGLPFFRNFFNYLSSPFNIIMLLFNRDNIITSLSVIIGLKALASSVTMSYYLNKKFGRNYLFIPLALFYAFSAYYIAYYWNVMWLDGMVWLPLIVLGIEKLIDDNKVLLYVLSLSIAILSNYFIGYMLCITSVLYFITYLILKTKKIDIKAILKKCLLFGICSIIAGGICAIALLPIYDALRETSAVNDSIPTSLYYTFTFKEFLFNHLSLVDSTVLSSSVSNAPNISVGVISMALLWAFILNPKISIKTKICYLCLLLVVGISFFVPILDFIWHAFHVPNDLPYRFSFIYSFIIIVIAAYQLNDIKELNKIDASLIYLGMLLLITCAKKYNPGNISEYAIRANYVLITIAYICCMFKNIKKLKYVLISIFGVEALVSGIMYINNNWSVDLDINRYYENYNEITSLTNKVQDKDFYRIEREYIDRLSDPCWYGYNGMVGFSSMEYYDLALLFNYMGLPTNGINSFYHRYNTPIYNMMFDLRYIIGNNNLDYYDKMYDAENNSLYEFKYKTSLMYGVNEDIKTFIDEIGSPFYNQNDFISKATGVDDVLTEMEVIEQSIVYEDDIHTIVEYKVNNNHDNYYLYVNSDDIDFIATGTKLFYTSDDYEYSNECEKMDIYEYIDYNEPFIITSKGKNDYITFYVGYNYYDGDLYDIFELDNDKWNIAYEYLSSNALDVNLKHDSRIETSSNFNEKKTIYTSIPYDRGWQVYIDGKKTNTYRIGHSLLGFDVDAGKHAITLEYHIPYIKIGIIISSLSIVGLIILVRNNKKHSS